jgi:hypothetical protein
MAEVVYNLYEPVPHKRCFNMEYNEKNLSVRPHVGPKCGTHTFSSAIQTHLITRYRSTHDFRHLEDLGHSDVEFCSELEFN